MFKYRKTVYDTNHLADTVNVIFSNIRITGGYISLFIEIIYKMATIKNTSMMNLV